MIQDNYRERRQVRLFGLLANDSSRIDHDAVDEFGYRYELKTTTRSGVSTARDVTIDYIDKWRGRLWLVSEWDESGDSFKSHYLLTRDAMKDWFDEIETKIKSHSTLHRKLSKFKKTLSVQEKKDLEYIFNRGTALNNPKLPMSYVRENGIKLNKRSCKKSLREAIKEHVVP